MESVFPQAQNRAARTSKSMNAELVVRFDAVRGFTLELCEGLATEDFVVQTMPDVSPTKWHLAHTTWFFENFILIPFAVGYRPFDSRFLFLFNSYYVSQGDRHHRPSRGFLSRPTVTEIMDYRRHVDAGMRRLLRDVSEKHRLETAKLLEVGLNHEQQHQELMLTDLKHVFSVNPLRPVYRHGSGPEPKIGNTPELTWTDHAEGLVDIGNPGAGFSYDNERPRHKVFLHAHALADRLVTNGDYLEFIREGGYAKPLLWLSDGWELRCREGWESPLYWEKREDSWWTFTLRGMEKIDPSSPVCHVSYYEADAFARWSEARLPTEQEWESAVGERLVEGNFAESGKFHPSSLAGSSASKQFYGDVWEWTSSHYSAFPGFVPEDGGLGEYNGKFMVNQFVLRGGSCASSASHLRATYRNFFPAHARWQFSGFRLAKNRKG